MGINRGIRDKPCTVHCRYKSIDRQFSQEDTNKQEIIIRHWVGTNRRPLMDPSHGPHVSPLMDPPIEPLNIGVVA